MGSGQSVSKEEFEEIMRGTKLDMKEIESIHKVFQKDFPRGKITRNEFITVVKKWFSNTEEAQDFTDHLFRTYDTDGDGSICFKEFLTSMSLAKNGSTEDKLKWAFKMYDIDGNGEISPDELIQILTALLKAKGEDDAKKKAKEAARTIMKLDTDKNGNLSLKEFVDGALKNPDIHDLLKGKLKK